MSPQEREQNKKVILYQPVDASRGELFRFALKHLFHTISRVEDLHASRIRLMREWSTDMPPVGHH